MKKYFIVVSIVIVIGAGLYLLSNKSQPETNPASSAPVITDGKQIIEITAKGGYFPQTTKLRADVPTVLKFKTAGTFDCSSALVIPLLKYRANLPASGETLVEVPPQASGTTLNGLCAMGMYGFELKFE